MTTIDIDDLAQIILQVDRHRDLGPGALAEAILDRLPAPQIIRTVEELEALDPDTLLMHRVYRALIRPGVADETDLPLSVVTPGEQVRAARKALEEA